MIQSSIGFYLHHIDEFLKNIVEEILKNLQFFSTYLQGVQKLIAGCNIEVFHFCVFYEFEF